MIISFSVIKVSKELETDMNEEDSKSQRKLQQPSSQPVTSVDYGFTHIYKTLTCDCNTGKARPPSTPLSNSASYREKTIPAPYVRYLEREILYADIYKRLAVMRIHVNQTVIYKDKTEDK